MEDKKDMTEVATKPLIERSTWTSKLEFVLCCIGNVVGLGNLWRFPYICMKYGGGAFIIPYMVCLFTVGLPALCLELVLGQFSSSAVPEVWNLCPLFKGLGWGVIILCAVATCVYTNITAWILYYLALSMNVQVPWSSCNNTWNTDRCATFDDNPAKNQTLAGSFFNISNGTKVNSLGYVSPTSEFFNNKILTISGGITEMGDVSWQLAVCMALVRLILFLCILKGVRTSGKVVYVTAIVPYVFLTILLVRGVTLPGSLEGIKMYIIPNWSKLADPEVWTGAVFQVFFSLGLGWGTNIVIASYNKFDYNCTRDTYIICLINSLTSFLAGFIIFSVIGFLAYSTETSVEEFTTKGPGLVFIAYPEAISKLPVAPLWAVLFFLMLLTLAIDSQFVDFEVVVTSIIDAYPEYLKERRTYVLAGLSCVFFLLSLPFTMQGGMYLFQMIDWYISNVTVTLVVFLTCVVVSYIYGVGRLYNDMTLMFGRPSRLWAVFWAGISPVVLTVMLVYSIVNNLPLTYNDYIYPDWVHYVGTFLTFATLIPLPVMACYLLYNTEGSVTQKFVKLLRPNKAWGPLLPENRAMDKFYHSKCSWKQRFFIRKSNTNHAETVTEVLDPGCDDIMTDDHIGYQLVSTELLPKIVSNENCA